MSNHWHLRPVPQALEDTYVTEGFWTDATLGSRTAAWLADAPDCPVHIHSRDRPWHGTFRDVESEARKLVTVLRRHGVEPGATVAFQLPNCREAISAFAGLAIGGCVLVPIVAIYGRKEVGFILRECGAEAYISRATFGHVDYLEIVADPPPNLKLHLVVESPPGTDAPAGIERLDWEDVTTAEPFEGVVETAATEPVVLAYTSGTTSDPKGVIHDHRTLLAELQHINAWVDPQRPNLMGSPVTHATGMLGAVLSPFALGTPIHLIDRWDPAHALEVIAEQGVGGGTGASFFLASLIDHPDFTPAHATNMARVGLGGAPVPVALGERAERLGIKIIRAYGSTEHPSITGSRYDDPPAIRHTTDGRPRPGVEMKIVDDLGAEVPAGVAGEIVSRGPDLCMGYTNPDLNSAFDDEGWYHTGDIGILDDDGALTITDRLKDIIIRGGENISAAEIEEVIAGISGVAEVAVVAAPDTRLGEHACAIIPLAARRRAGRSRCHSPVPRNSRAGPTEVARRTPHRYGLPPHCLGQNPQGGPASPAPPPLIRGQSSTRSQAPLTTGPRRGPIGGVVLTEPRPRARMGFSTGEHDRLTR